MAMQRFRCRLFAVAIFIEFLGTLALSGSAVVLGASHRNNVGSLLEYNRISQESSQAPAAAPAGSPQQLDPEDQAPSSSEAAAPAAAPVAPRGLHPRNKGAQPTSGTSDSRRRTKKKKKARVVSASPPRWLDKIPTVTHIKSAGDGYSEKSPFFRKQKATRSAKLKSAPIISSPTNQTADKDDDGFFPPVPTAMQCIIDLTAQFFIVYTILFIVQTLNRRKLVDWEREEKCLVAILETIFFVPMLCILFLTVRLRAMQLSQGQVVELFDLPQWWVKGAMVLCSWSMQVQTILVFGLATLNGEGEHWEAVAKKQGLGNIGKAMLTLRNAALLTIYCSFSVICFGLCTMPAPEKLWGEEGGPSLSAAVFCVILLTVLYFFVYLCLAVARLANELGLLGRTLRFSQTQELLKSTTTTVAFVPMLGALFIAARLRATQLDPVHGNPQQWVQVWFYICSGSVIVQTFLVLARSFLETRASQERDNRSLSAKFRGIEIVRLLAMGLLYVGAVAIILGMYLMEPKDEEERTPKMPVSLRCVALLTALYFLVYMALWIITAVQKNTAEAQPLGSPTNRRQTGASDSRRSNAFLSNLEVFLAVRAKEAVAFCPMFCVLFLATFMRALQITGNTGAPQEWCQNLQYLASWSIVLLTISRVDVLLARGSSPVISSLCEGLQYAFFFVLYISAIFIIVALYTMTPENAVGVTTAALM